jgi:hypothetical protein
MESIQKKNIYTNSSVQQQLLLIPKNVLISMMKWVNQKTREPIVLDKSQDGINGCSLGGHHQCMIFNTFFISQGI